MASKKEEESTALSNVAPTRLAVQAPDFMKNDANKGKDLLIGAVRPPYIKVVKGQSKGDLKKYGVGSAVIMPEGQVIYKEGDPGFHFVVVWYYPEFACVNPYQLADKLPTIRKRTTDPQSELARKCKDPATWKVPCPEDPKFNLQNREIMTFIVMILDDNMKPMEYATMSFSGGEHKTGRRLASMVTTKQCAPYGGIYHAKTSVHKYQQGKYESEGFDIEVDPDHVFVEDEATYLELQALSELFEKAHAERRIDTIIDADDVGPGEGSSDLDQEAEDRF